MLLWRNGTADYRNYELIKRCKSEHEKSVRECKPVKAHQFLIVRTSTCSRDRPRSVLHDWTLQTIETSHPETLTRGKSGDGVLYSAVGRVYGRCGGFDSRIPCLFVFSDRMLPSTRGVTVVYGSFRSRCLFSVPFMLQSIYR